MTNYCAAALTLSLLCVACASPPSEPPKGALAPSSGPPASPPTASTAAANPAITAGATASATPTPTPPTLTDSLVGRPAPDFTATAQDGTRVKLAELKGKPVVVYFYPKDETAGCTKEACSFRDAWQPITKTGAVLIGVSADTLDSHRSFVAHYKLPFLLVSDPDGSLGQAYGVPFAGHHRRQTIVIGSDGVVRKVYRTVDVTVHAQQVLADLTQS